MSSSLLQSPSELSWDEEREWCPYNVETVVATAAAAAAADVGTLKAAGLQRESESEKKKKKKRKRSPSVYLISILTLMF